MFRWKLVKDDAGIQVDFHILGLSSKMTERDEWREQKSSMLDNKAHLNFSFYHRSLTGVELDWGSYVW